MQEGTDYCFVTPKDTKDNRMHIKLLSGIYTDVIFRYGALRFEEKEDGMHLLFNYDIIDGKKMKNLEKNTEFKNYIGNLLTELLSGRLEEQDIEIEDDNAIRANNTP
jgi:hypothetical protein